MDTLIDLTNATPESFNLKNALDSVLAGVVAAFLAHNVDLPVRRYWSMGVPIVDCEQLVVSLIQMYLGIPGDEANRPHRGEIVRSAVLSVSIARNIPVMSSNGHPPEPDKIQQAGAISAVDAWIMMEAAVGLDAWDAGGAGIGVIATVESPVSEGGFQSITMQVTMAIP